MSENKTKRIPLPSYSQETVHAALDAIKEGKMTIRGAARYFNIPHSTLGDKLSGRRPIKPPVRTELRREEEDKLVEWMIESARRGCSIGQETIRRQVQTILSNEKRDTTFVNFKPSRSWYYRFLKRHPQVDLRKNIELIRTEDNERKLRIWWEAKKNLAEASCDKPNVKIEGTRVFNTTETEFPYDPGASSSTSISTPAPEHKPFTVGPTPASHVESQPLESIPATSTSKATALTKLLVMVNKWDEAKFLQIMRKQKECAIDSSDDEFNEFKKLWHELVPQPCINTLPLPKCLGSTFKNCHLNKGHKIKPPKYAHRNKFKQFLEEKERNTEEKMEETEQKNRRKWGEKKRTEKLNKDEKERNRKKVKTRTESDGELKTKDIKEQRSATTTTSTSTSGKEKLMESSVSSYETIGKECDCDEELRCPSQ